MLMLVSFLINCLTNNIEGARCLVARPLVTSLRTSSIATPFACTLPFPIVLLFGRSDCEDKRVGAAHSSIPTLVKSMQNSGLGCLNRVMTTSAHSEEPCLILNGFAEQELLDVFVGGGVPERLCLEMCSLAIGRGGHTGSLVEDIRLEALSIRL